MQSCCLLLLGQWEHSNTRGASTSAYAVNKFLQEGKRFRGCLAITAKKVNLNYKGRKVFLHDYENATATYATSAATRQWCVAKVDVKSSDCMFDSQDMH